MCKTYSCRINGIVQKISSEHDLQGTSCKDRNNKMCVYKKKRKVNLANTTIQKIQDKRLLYWKFERTQIWIDFINDGYVIPPPFLIFAWLLSCVFYLAGIFGVTVKRWHNKRHKNQTETKPSIIENGNDAHRKSGKKYLCKMDPNEARRRKAHAILMNKLISNLLLKTNYHTT